MEQAVNLFNKGLQLDTNPMVLGNDTLTNALNATFVTMNGNEVVLQNDMGNRKVDNACLPAGYEPVGIKEYGGIIYLALYNPITNKSQIGSFPSPERKFSPEDFKDGGDNLSNDLNLSLLEAINSERKLTTHELLIPLTTKNTLHAGDKFVVYCPELWGNVKSKITNFNNTNGTKVISPKNKKYTLALGILNSLNEFVDITKTLRRWNNSTLIEYGEGISDLYKFNDGYFIANGKPSGVIDSTTTIKDRELDKERLKMPVNTYTYKLVGPLYLKAVLNCILNFDYNIYGTYDSISSKATLYVESYITYNCPDWVNSNNSSADDDNYLTYKIGTINKGWFKFNDDDGTIINSSDKISYDVSTNLYFAKVVKKFENITSGDYTIKVLPNSEVSNGYLEIYSGHLDLTKLGSGEVDLKSWRFFSKDLLTTFTYSLEAYLKYGYSFSNLNVKFTRVGGPSKEFTLDNLRIVNGKASFTLDWNKYNINPRELYEVTITGSLKSEIENLEESFTFIRWFLATTLMNDCYSIESPLYVEDFGNPKTETETTILENKLTIPQAVNLNAVNNSGDIKYATEATSGKWVGKNLSKIEVSYEHLFNVNIGINPTILAVNLDLYPDFITETTNASSYTINTSIDTEEIDSYDSSIKNNSVKIGNPTNITENYITVGTFSTYPDSRSPRNISGLIKFYDRFKSNINTEKNIINPFVKISDANNSLRDAIFDISGSNYKLKRYGGLGVDYDSKKGDDDGHMLNIYTLTNSNDGKVELERPDAAAPAASIGKRLGLEWNDGEVDFTYAGYKDKIQTEFNSFGNDVTFFYILEKLNSSSSNQPSNGMCSNRDRQKPSQLLTRYARIWWRDYTGNWAIFAKPMESSDNLWNFILKQLFNNNLNIVYSYKSSVKCSDLSLSVPDNLNYTHNSKYSVPITIKVEAQPNGVFNTLQSNPSILCKNKENLYKIEFNFGNNGIVGSASLQMELKSSEDFLDEVNTMVSEADLENIYVDNYKKVDIDGKELLSDSFYSLDSGGNLIKQPELNKKIKISDTFGANGCRGIVYNKTTYGCPPLRYDCCGWDHHDHWTLFDYDGINVVSS